MGHAEIKWAILSKPVTQFNPDPNRNPNPNTEQSHGARDPVEHFFRGQGANLPLVW